MGHNLTLSCSWSSDDSMLQWLFFFCAEKLCSYPAACITKMVASWATIVRLAKFEIFFHQCRKLSYSTSCVMLCFDNFLQRERTILIRSLVVIRWSQSVDYVLRGQLGFPPPPFRRLQLFLTHESNGIVCINTPKVHNIQMFANLDCMLIIELLINLMQFECGLCNLVHVALDIWLILSGWDIFFRSWWEKHFNF